MEMYILTELELFFLVNIFFSASTHVGPNEQFSIIAVDAWYAISALAYTLDLALDKEIPGKIAKPFLCDPGFFQPLKHQLHKKLSAELFYKHCCQTV